MTTTPPPHRNDAWAGFAETTPRERAVWSLQRAIQTAAREAFGAAIVERPIPGFSLPDRDVEPLAGVRAAALARGVAADRLQHYAQQARADGHSWNNIAEALGMEGGDGQWSQAELAYLHLIEGQPMHPHEERPRQPSPTAHWRCASCGELVTDRGPFEAAPDNNETGHAPDCARHAAEVAAYRDEWGDE